MLLIKIGFTEIDIMLQMNNQERVRIILKCTTQTYHCEWRSFSGRLHILTSSGSKFIIVVSTVSSHANRQIETKSSEQFKKVKPLIRSQNFHLNYFYRMERLHNFEVNTQLVSVKHIHSWYIIWLSSPWNYAHPFSFITVLEMIFRFENIIKRLILFVSFYWIFLILTFQLTR